MITDAEALVPADDGYDVLLPHKGDGERGSRRLPLQDRAWWRLVHAAGFATGGLTFIAGTALYYAPDQTTAVGNLAAALYTIGSVGFLSVDVLEFFTPDYTTCPLRANIALSATGSTFYVIGSVGYAPAILAVTEAVGVWGFILGSAFIGVSQTWKVARLASGDDGVPRLRNVLASRDVLTAVGVEAGACAGAWFFLAGTAMYDVSTTTDGGWLAVILGLWLAGSCCFTVGAAFLAYRHFVMRIS
jgi:hypothetical protein